MANKPKKKYLKEFKDTMKEERETEVKNELPDDYDLEDILADWDTCTQEWAQDHKTMRLLDAADSGKFWEVVSAKFPAYQIKPDSNYINYTKEHILGNIYSVGKVGTLIPRSEADLDLVVRTNQYLDHIWGVANVPYFQMQAGERAALLNLGLTMVGWKAEAIGGTEEMWYEGDVVFKNIDPMNYMRDPYAENIETAGYAFYYTDYHKNVLKNNAKYKQAIKDYEKKKIAAKEDGFSNSPSYYNQKKSRGSDYDANDNYYRLVIHWRRVNEHRVDEIHLLNGEEVIYVKVNIKPSTIPIAELYCNPPAGKIVGTSEPRKIWANYVTNNLMNSIAATHAYKAHRPNRFVSQGAGLNLRQFSKYGNDPDRTWITTSPNPEMAVRYGEAPPLPPNLDSLKQSMIMESKDITGVDDRYTGRDTGSAITTGGVEGILNRVTDKDNVKIQMYEMYTERLTRLVLKMVQEYADERTIYTKEEGELAGAMLTIDPKKELTDKDGLPKQFDYEVSISSLLPKNKQRIAESATMLLEKQMQYKPQPEIITVEEWALLQDLPYKELMLTRMGLQRGDVLTEQVVQTLFQFSELVQSGISPDEAVTMVTDTLKAAQDPMNQPKLGNVAEMPAPGSPQMAQAGGMPTGPGPDIAQMLGGGGAPMPGPGGPAGGGLPPIPGM